MRKRFLALPDPLLITAEEAAAMCGKSVRTWRSWNSAALVPRPLRIGRSTFWRPEEIRAWIAAGTPNRKAWESSPTGLPMFRK